ncbi:MAG: class I SAM-dependent methyltransferase [Candidatus Sulfotelmatobacter sp.]
MTARKGLARLLRLVPVSNGAGNKAIDRLMGVYKQRPDLREVFPEAADGDKQRFINWAAGVSTKQWADDAFAALAPSVLWYCAHHKPVTEVEAPSPWPVASETSAASRNRLTVTLSVVQDAKANDISDHLLTMALLVTEFKLKHVVELGTRSGNSTLALLEAVRGTGGRVLSIDVDACDDAKARVRAAGFDDIWTFIQGDDLALDDSVLPKAIDLLFIDTNHLYAQTIAELQKYSSRLLEGSWILLHDYVEFPGVRRAVHEFVAGLPYRPSFYPFANKNGLAVLRLQGAADNHQG